MNEFLTVVLYPTLFAFLGIAGTKIWDWIKPKTQKQIDTADARSREIDNEIKSAAFYKDLLDDMSNRLEAAITAIEHRDKRIKERDDKIELLIDEIELMTFELRKYKQLNGKTSEPATPQ